MNTVQLYGSGSSTANAVAQVIIPKASRIKGVQVSVYFDAATDNSDVVLEVSRASATEQGVNGAQQSIVRVAAACNLTTSGANVWGLNKFFPVDVPVVQGQIIYLHATVGGTAAYDFSAILHYS